jgi:hypothetical protein
VGALNIGTPKNEAEAESMLAAVGIAPRNGWISDYPVTPDIVAEIQKAVSDAADANRLPMGKSDSLNALQNVETSAGLAVVPDTSGTYAEAQPPTTPQYTEPSVVNNYYYDEGPPVLTYYPPPWDYYYLYAWVPSPFWSGGFFFPGFFILNDFSRTFFVNRSVFVVSNHVFDRGHHRFFTVDPVRRRRGAGDSWRVVGQRSEGRRFITTEGRRGAESILQRSHNRVIPSRGLTERNVGVSGGFHTRSFNRGGERAQFAPHQNFRGISGGSERSFNAPGRGGGRSFSSPIRSGGRSFSPPSNGSRGLSGLFHGGGKSSSPPPISRGRSFSAPSIGSRGFSGGFGGGSRGFSGGFSRGFHGGSFGGFHGGGFRHR